MDHGWLALPKPERRQLAMEEVSVECIEERKRKVDGPSVNLPGSKSSNNTRVKGVRWAPTPEVDSTIAGSKVLMNKSSGRAVPCRSAGLPSI